MKFHKVLLAWSFVFLALALLAMLFRRAGAHGQVMGAYTTKAFEIILLLVFLVALNGAALREKTYKYMSKNLWIPALVCVLVFVWVVFVILNLVPTDFLPVKPTSNYAAVRTIVSINISSLEENKDFKFFGTTEYLRNAKAVVVHSLDDSTEHTLEPLRLLDKYNIKATFFVDTAYADDLWSGLRQAVASGHEVGSHTRTHQCPDKPFSCWLNYNNYELVGSVEDIKRNTGQIFVWSFAYPCGKCSNYNFIHDRLSAAGLLVARTYSEQETKSEKDFCSDPYRCGYTVLVQDMYPGTQNFSYLNSLFDDVYDANGVYHLVSHPQWLNLSDGSYYDQHLSHISGKSDVWYATLGELYAYRVAASGISAVLVKRDGSSLTYLVQSNVTNELRTVPVTLKFRDDNNLLYVTVVPGMVLDFKLE